VSSAIAYYNYRKNWEQQYLTSEYSYKLLKAKNIDAGNQFMYGRPKDRGETAKYSLYYRMPEAEYNLFFRMRSSFIEGYFDHNKEILIPKKKDSREGYEIVTPFYYYLVDGIDTENKVLTQDGSVMPNPVPERAAIAVHRGWYFLI
jgi:hypothetical protein